MPPTLDALYRYIYKPEKPAAINSANSMQFDPVRPMLAPSATDLKRRAREGAK